MRTITLQPAGDEGRPRRNRSALAVLLLSALATMAAPALPARAAPGVTATACGAPDAPAGPRIEVVVTGAHKVAGNITITLYGPDPRDFLAAGRKTARQRIMMHGPEVEACFAVSAEGNYAIAVYHDENNDHDFKRNLLGLPAEGYGFSNDAPTLLGLPSYDSVRFHVGPEGVRMPIKLRY